jgi:hypothetical protein
MLTWLRLSTPDITGLARPLAYCDLENMRYACMPYRSFIWLHPMNQNLNFFLVVTVSIIMSLHSGHAQSADSIDYVSIAKTRLAEMDEIDMGKNWFYTITAHTDEEVLVSRNHPHKEEGARRELLSVDGEPPSPERLKEFEEKQAERLKDEDSESSRDRFSEMVDFSTLELVEVSNGQALLSFTPVLDGLEKESDKLNGSLRLNTDSQLIENLSLVNTDKLSPAFSVSLKTFNMSFSFSPVDGDTLLSRMETSIEGKAGFLKKFKTSTEIVFSDYQRLSGSARK